MEPKFQSSFIPKGPLTSSPSDVLMGRKPKSGGLFSFIATIIFIISVVSALGVFGYKFYLKYSIEKMGTALDEARAELQPEVINELTRFDNRIISTKELLSKHRVLTPVFEFLESSTPKTVRFSEFRYLISGQGLELHMRGEARGYAALALQADIFNKSDYFKDPVFSDLSLNQRGEVVFSFTTVIDPNLVSYQRGLESIETSPSAIPEPILEPPVSSVSTSSQQATPN